MFIILSFFKKYQTLIAIHAILLQLRRTTPLRRKKKQTRTAIMKGMIGVKRDGRRMSGVMKR